MKSIKHSSLYLDLILIFIAFVWGSGFPMTNMALTAGVTPALLSAIRFGIASFLMAIVFRKELLLMTKRDFKFGFNAGFILFLAFTAQTYGLLNTSTSNNAFLTSSNVIMVPFVCWIALKQRPSSKTVALAFSCFVGMTILSGSGGGINFNLGDWLSILSAFLYSCHVTYLSTSVGKAESVAAISFLQMFVASFFSFLVFLVAESNSFSVEFLKAGILPILYLAIFPGAICFFLQSWIQRKVLATRAAIVFSTEGLFGSILAVMIGYDKVTPNLVIGGSIILTSVMLTQFRWASIATKFKKG